jgi:hypothetical protein
MKELNLDEVRRLYYFDRLSITDIARRVGVSYGCLWTFMRDNGLERRGFKDLSAKMLARSNGAKRVDPWNLRWKKWGEWNSKRPEMGDLERMYIDEGQSCEEIGRVVGVHFHRVRAWLDEYGMKFRPKSLKMKKPRKKFWERKYGEKSVRWKGGKFRYWHNMARRIWEEYVGEKLTRHDAIHHIDGNEQNNEIWNLLKLTRKEHAKLHHHDRLAGHKKGVEQIKA